MRMLVTAERSESHDRESVRWAKHFAATLDETERRASQSKTIEAAHATWRAFDWWWTGLEELYRTTPSPYIARVWTKTCMAAVKTNGPEEAEKKTSFWRRPGFIDSPAVFRELATAHALLALSGGSSSNHPLTVARRSVVIQLWNYASTSVDANPKAVKPPPAALRIPTLVAWALARLGAYPGQEQHQPIRHGRREILGALLSKYEAENKLQACLQTLGRPDELRVASRLALLSHLAWDAQHLTRDTLVARVLSDTCEWFADPSRTDSLPRLVQVIRVPLCFAGFVHSVKRRPEGPVEVSEEDVEAVVAITGMPRHRGTLIDAPKHAAKCEAAATAQLVALMLQDRGVDPTQAVALIHDHADATVTTSTLTAAWNALEPRARMLLRQFAACVSGRTAITPHEISYTGRAQISAAYAAWYGELMTPPDVDLLPICLGCGHASRNATASRKRTGKRSNSAGGIEKLSVQVPALTLYCERGVAGEDTEVEDGAALACAREPMVTLHTAGVLVYIQTEKCKWTTCSRCLCVVASGSAPTTGIAFDKLTGAPVCLSCITSSTSAAATTRSTEKSESQRTGRRVRARRAEVHISHVTPEREAAELMSQQMRTISQKDALL